MDYRVVPATRLGWDGHKEGTDTYKEKLDPGGAWAPTMPQPRSLTSLSHASEKELPYLRRR